MKDAPSFPASVGRKAGAWVCLLAVLLLWSPLWAVALQTASMGCCSGGMCPLHGHTNQGETPRPDEPKEMTCEHHGGAGMVPCKMSCCQDVAHSVVASAIFVLPGAFVFFRSLPVVHPVILSGKREIVPAIAPPDLPPRLFAS